MGAREINDVGCLAQQQQLINSGIAIQKSVPATTLGYASESITYLSPTPPLSSTITHMTAAPHDRSNTLHANRHIVRHEEAENKQKIVQGHLDLIRVSTLRARGSQTYW